MNCQNCKAGYVGRHRASDAPADDLFDAVREATTTTIKEMEK